jgi:hypothetical protein
MHMLSTEIMALGLVLAAFACLISVFVWRMSQKMDAACRYVYSQNKNSLSLRKMADVEVALTELSDAYDALLSSHKKLRARIGMRRNRDKSNGQADDLPDSRTDPGAFKRAMRLRLREKKAL